MDTLIRKLKESGQLLTVDREVDPLYELAAVTRSSQKRDNSALLFNNVMGTKFPVVTNLYGSRQRLCEIIGPGVKVFASDGTRFLIPVSRERQKQAGYRAAVESASGQAE